MSPGPRGPASRQTLALPRLWWTLTFPEPEAVGLGCEDPGCVRGQLRHEGKDREALLHPPSRQESEAARRGLLSQFSFPTHWSQSSSGAEIGGKDAAESVRTV